MSTFVGCGHDTCKVRTGQKRLDNTLKMFKILNDFRLKPQKGYVGFRMG